MSAYAGVYAAWIAAWMELGHCPRPKIDDPKSVGGVCEPVYALSQFLLFWLPLGLLINAAFVACAVAYMLIRFVFPGRSPEPTLWQLTICVVAISIGCFANPWFDPFRAIEWYSD